MKRLLLALVTAGVLLLSGFAVVASAGQLFAPIYSADKIALFTSDPSSGALSAAAGSPFASGSTGQLSWAMTADGNIGVAGFLYGGFHPFTVAASGAITEAQAQVSWPSGNGTYSVAVAPNGKSVYGANRDYPPSANPAGIRAYSLSATGTVAELSGSPYVTGLDFFDVAITPDGSKLFATTGSEIYHASINSDGTLGTLTPQTFNGATYITPSPDGRFLYLTGNSAGSSYFRSLAIAADGVLSSAGLPITLGSGTARAAVASPDGAFVYAADANIDQVYSIRIAPDGTPAVVGAPTAFDEPYQLTLSGDGKFLYVTNTGSDYAIDVSPIGADGRPTGFTKAAPYNAGEAARIVFRPGQGTTARVKSAPQSAVLTTRFDGSGSTAAAGSVGSYAWDFGDGTTATGAAPKHKFAKSGVYNVTLTAMDDAGCSTKVIYDGRSTTCNGKPTAAKTVKYDTPPWLTSLKLSKNKVKFKLTEKANVSFYAQKPIKGRTVGSKCKKQTVKNKSRKKCTLWVRASKTFRASGKAGKTNSAKFVGRSKLARGSYRLYAVATDAAKGKGPAATVKFKVKR